MIDKNSIKWCKFHPDQQAMGNCESCGAYICNSCKNLGPKYGRGGRRKTLCPDCIISAQDKRISFCICEIVLIIIMIAIF